MHSLCDPYGLSLGFPIWPHCPSFPNDAVGRLLSRWSCLSRSVAEELGLGERGRCLRWPVEAVVIHAVWVDNPDATRPRQGNEAALLQIRQRTAHRLNGKRQIVRDVIARGKQQDAVIGLPAAALLGLQQEGSDLFPRRCVAHDEQ